MSYSVGSVFVTFENIVERVAYVNQLFFRISGSPHASSGFLSQCIMSHLWLAACGECLGDPQPVQYTLRSRLIEIGPILQ